MHGKPCSFWNITPLFLFYGCSSSCRVNVWAAAVGGGREWDERGEVEVGGRRWWAAHSCRSTLGFVQIRRLLHSPQNNGRTREPPQPAWRHSPRFQNEGETRVEKVYRGPCLIWRCKGIREAYCVSLSHLSYLACPQVPRMIWLDEQV